MIKNRQPLVFADLKELRNLFAVTSSLEILLKLLTKKLDD